MSAKRSSAIGLALDDGSSPIHHCCRMGTKHDLVKLLKKDKELLNVRDSDGQTPLHILCMNGFDDLAVMVVDKYKADVNAVDANGWTPLHSAASEGHLQVCELLVNRGAFVRALTNEGASALHYIVRNNHNDPVLFQKVLGSFLAKGADINQKNKHGETPLHQAARRGRAACLLSLLNNKAEVNSTDNVGQTPLHMAIQAKSYDCVQSLLNFGANPLLACKTGTCLEVAQSVNSSVVIEMIRAATKAAPDGTSAMAAAAASAATAAFEATPSPALTRTRLSEQPISPDSRRRAASVSMSSAEVSPAGKRDSVNSTRRETLSENVITQRDKKKSTSGSSGSVGSLPTSDEGSARTDDHDETSTELQPSLSTSGGSNAPASSVLPTLSDPLKKRLDEGWMCRVCCKSHPALPAGFFMRAPKDWEELPSEARGKRTKLSADLCSIDNARFYVRVLVELPICGAGDSSKTPLSFTWGLWASVTPAVFQRVLDSWNSTEAVTFDATLNSELPLYPQTTGLPLVVHTRLPGQRPVAELAPNTDHPLAKEREAGLTVARVDELLCKLFAVAK